MATARMGHTGAMGGVVQAECRRAGARRASGRAAALLAGWLVPACAGAADGGGTPPAIREPAVPAPAAGVSGTTAAPGPAGSATVVAVPAAGTATGVVEAAAPSATVVAPPAAPALSGFWSVPPSGGCARLPFTVILTLSNSGLAEAAGIRARLRLEGTAGATVLEAPVVPESIPAGGSAVLGWRLVAPGAGTVQVRARVRAHDSTGTVTADSGRIVAPELAFVEPGGLAAAVATRVEASVGQWVAVAVTVSNTGGVRVDRVVPVLAGPAAGRFRTMPPPVPNLSIEPGAALRLLWTWSVAGAGSHLFTASVFADTCEGALSVGASASVWLSAVPPAALAGAIALSATRLVSGQQLLVRFTVSNTGGAAATGVTVPLPTPTTSRAKLATGPMRATLAALPPGSATELVWAWTMDGVGPAWFTGRATAHDGNADWTVGTGLVDSPRVRLLAPPRVKADQFTLFPEPRVRVGGYVTASLILTNTGESPAVLTGLDIREATNPGGLLIQRSLVSPSLPAELPGGDSRSVVWTYRTNLKGTAKLEATAKLKEAVTGKAMADVKAASNQITATGFVSP